MPSRFIQSIVASRNSSTLRSMPLRADNAWRRNWITDTPAISCGYWNARNIPALARTSGDQSVMSSPWKKTLPLGTSYSREANNVLARLLLAQPLGPMMACASPALTVRDNPRRISPGFSFGADSLGAGLACRSSMRKSSLPAVVMPSVYFPYGRSGNPCEHLLECFRTGRGGGEDSMGCCPLGPQCTPDGGIRGVLEGIVDVPRIPECLVEAGQVAERYAGIDVVSQVPADVVRHQEEPCEQVLADRVSGLAAVLRTLHPAVFGDRTQPVDHPPYGEIGRHPHHRVQPPVARNDRPGQQHCLHGDDLPHRPP